MLQMGNTYYKEENTEKAYMLYVKFLTLFLEKVIIIITIMLSKYL